MKSFVFVGIMLASLLLMLSIGMAQPEENNMNLPENNSTDMNTTVPVNASIEDNQSETAEEASDKASESSPSSC
jgi:cytoskeletal protein RodZ